MQPTKTIYAVILIRNKTDSRIKIEIAADNIKQAEKEAQSQFLGWKVSLVAKK